MVAGFIERSETPTGAVPGTTSFKSIFYMITGLFHSRNRTFEFNNKIEFDNGGHYRQNYQQDNKFDGFKSLLEDPENKVNTIAAIQFKSTVSTDPSNFQSWVFSMTRDLLDLNWMFKAPNSNAPFDIQCAMLKDSKQLFVGLVKGKFIHLYEITLDKGIIKREKTYEVQ